MASYDPHFANSAPTKYAFGQHARITISNPTPQHYVQKARDAHVLVLMPVLDGDILVPLADALPETFRQAEFDLLWKDKKVSVEPHHFDEVRQRLAALNPGVDCLRNLPRDELTLLEFYRRLVVRVEVLRDETGASLTDEALEPLIAKAHLELVAEDLRFAQGLSDEDEEDEGKNKKGAKKGAGKGRRRQYNVPDSVSPSTWRKYRRCLLAFAEDLLSLRDGRTATAVLRLPRITETAVVEVMSRWVRAFLDRSRPTALNLHKQMKAEFLTLNAERLANGLDELEIPSLSTFRRRIKKLDPYEVTLARQGPAAARRKFKIAARHDTGIAPGDRVPMDNWRTNVSALKLPRHFWAGMPDEWRNHLASLRLNLCLAIDEASKIILGVRLSLNPSSDTSIKTLEMTARDKSAIAEAANCSSTWHHCLTLICVPTDGGPEFRREFRMTVRDLGATSEVGPAGKPDVRAIVERAFGTIDVQLMQHFAGRTGKNVADKGEYDPESMANVTIEVLSQCLVRWIVDVYHNSGHSSLGGETPNDAWARLNDKYGVLPPPDPARMRAVFGFRDQRAISNRGMRFLGLHYRSRELAVLRQKVGQTPLDIRVDLADLSQISVKDPRGAWLTVPNELDGFDGVTATEWIATGEALRRKHAKNAKLREPIVLKALSAIRKEGLAAAERAGIGPTTLSAEMVKAHERDLFMSFDIQVATTPGRALEGLDDDGPEELAASDAKLSGNRGAEAEPNRPAKTRRRRGAGSGFLSED